MNQAVETMKNHRAYRHFKSGKTLSPAHLQAILDCARQAPSWMNGQHCTIINITDSALREKIVALQPANPQVGTCSAFLIFVADLNRARLCSEAYGGDFGAASHSDNLITAVTDASLAAQNAVVAAESLGYGTCFIGGMRFIAKDLIELLKLPKHTFPVFGLCIGEPDIEMRIKPRLPQAAVYAENAYPSEQILAESLEQYEQTMTEFGEAREKFPFREKFSRYYQSGEPRNEPLIFEQGWLEHLNKK